MSVTRHELTNHPHPDVPGLYRLRAGRDIPEHGVRAGDLGGWVHSATQVSDAAWVSDDAQVSASAQVYGGAWVSGNAQVYEGARVLNDARICGSAHVFGDAHVFGAAWVSGEARVSGDARVYGSARVYGDAWVSGDACVFGSARVYGDARVAGDARVVGSARVSHDAQVSKEHHVLAVAGLPSGDATLHPVVGGHLLRVGCWTGTVSELRALAQGDTGWPDARGNEIPLRRPGLLALADLCEAHMAAHGWGSVTPYHSEEP